MNKIIYDVEVDAYRALVSSEYEVEFSKDFWTYYCNHDEAKAAVNAEIERVQSIAPDHSLFLALGDSNNFRYSVYPSYKSNRRRYRRPPGHSRLKEWLCTTWPCLQLANVEGDDVVGNCAQPGDIIVSKDKDLNTIPGLHVDVLTGEIYEVSKWEADINFYTQILTGDSADGYPGCPKYGPKSAAKLLAGATTENQFSQRVTGAYITAASKDPETPSVLTMARCARILRMGEYDHENQRPFLWEPPMPSDPCMETFIPNFHD